MYILGHTTCVDLITNLEHTLKQSSWSDTNCKTCITYRQLSPLSGSLTLSELVQKGTFLFIEISKPEFESRQRTAIWRAIVPAYGMESIRMVGLYLRFRWLTLGRGKYMPTDIFLDSSCKKSEPLKLGWSCESPYLTSIPQVTTCPVSSWESRAGYEDATSYNSCRPK